MDNKRQRSARRGRREQAAHIDPFSRERCAQELAEPVIAHLADECDTGAQARERHGDVGRRATGRSVKVCCLLKRQRSVERDEVGQHLAQADDCRPAGRVPLIHASFRRRPRGSFTASC